jgi:mRNA interferase RelE/StbE
MAAAGKELAEVGSKADCEKLVARIRELATSARPRGSESLAGYADRYWIRQGSYRVIYLIDDEESVVTNFKIGHRRDVYR